jgi:site-specific DNA-methyltransferase (adenine-specific)
METNIIYNKDCIEGMKELPDESIDLVITDPPYGISYQSNYKQVKFKKLQNDDNLNWFLDFSKQVYRVLKNNTSLFLFTRADKIGLMMDNLISVGFKFKNMLIIPTANPTSCGDLSASFVNCFEVVLFFNKGRNKFRKTDLKKTSESYRNDKRFNAPEFVYRLPALWDFVKATEHNLNLVHPTQKSVEVFESMIKICSDENSIILDPFSGSGTSAIASLNTNRQFIGYEIDPQYYKLSLERLSDKTSTLSATQTTLAEPKEFNKDLTAQDKPSPKCPSDTSLNPDIKYNMKELLHA